MAEIATENGLVVGLIVQQPQEDPAGEVKEAPKPRRVRKPKAE